VLVVVVAVARIVSLFFRGYGAKKLGTPHVACESETFGPPSLEKSLSFLGMSCKAGQFLERSLSKNVMSVQVKDPVHEARHEQKLSVRHDPWSCTLIDKST